MHTFHSFNELILLFQSSFNHFQLESLLLSDLPSQPPYTMFKEDDIRQFILAMHKALLLDTYFGESVYSVVYSHTQCEEKMLFGVEVANHLTEQIQGFLHGLLVLQPNVRRFVFVPSLFVAIYLILALKIALEFSG